MAIEDPPADGVFLLPLFEEGLVLSESGLLVFFLVFFGVSVSATLVESFQDWLTVNSAKEASVPFCNVSN